ncbi:hypothetical protein N8Z26_07525, partial [Burkholderiales bacterium]|nr:hypothetical protein [Burkholderiales bacterium]
MTDVSFRLDSTVPKFNANLTMMFNEFDFMKRFNQARQQGFMGVEILFPYAYHKEEIGEALSKNNLELVL